jgi:ABC-type transport system involved in cytochrome c biogenesis permease component
MIKRAMDTINKIFKWFVFINITILVTIAMIRLFKEFDLSTLGILFLLMLLWVLSLSFIITKKDKPSKYGTHNNRNR